MMLAIVLVVVLSVVVGVALGWLALSGALSLVAATVRPAPPRSGAGVKPAAGRSTAAAP